MKINHVTAEKEFFRLFPMGADKIVDCTGSVSVVQHAMRLLKKGGRLVQYALVHSLEPLTFDPMYMFNNELTFMTTFCQSHNFGRSIEALADGRVNGDMLITGEFTLDRYYDALDYNVNDRDAIKVAVHPNA
jgi:D-arabinitol dehydrogenase (NADP+)